MKFAKLANFTITTLLLALLWENSSLSSLTISTLPLYSCKFIITAILCYNGGLFKAINNIPSLLRHFCAFAQDGAISFFVWGLGADTSTLYNIAKRANSILTLHNEEPHPNTNSASLNDADEATQIVHNSAIFFVFAITSNHLFSILVGAHLAYNHNIIGFIILIPWTVLSTFALWSLFSIDPIAGYVLVGYILLIATANFVFALTQLVSILQNPQTQATNQWFSAFTSISAFHATIPVSFSLLSCILMFTITAGCFAQGCILLNHLSDYQYILNNSRT